MSARVRRVFALRCVFVFGLLRAFYTLGSFDCALFFSTFFSFFLVHEDGTSEGYSLTGFVVLFSLNTYVFLPFLYTLTLNFYMKLFSFLSVFTHTGVWHFSWPLIKIYFSNYIISRCTPLYFFFFFYDSALCE